MKKIRKIEKSCLLSTYIVSFPPWFSILFVPSDIAFLLVFYLLFTNKQFLSGNQNLKKKKTDIYSNVLRLFMDFKKQTNGVFTTSSNVLIFMSLQPDTLVSVEVNISIYCCSAEIMIYLILDNELDRKIDVTAILFLLVQNRQQQTPDLTLIGSGAIGLGILEC